MEIVLIFGGIFAVLIIMGMILANRKRHKISTNERNRLIKEWNEIMNEALNNPKNAILEADKILDYALKLKGFEGSLGEKLKKGGCLFKNSDDVWFAHKWRNQIAHERGVKIRREEAKLILSRFRQALKDLGI